MGTVDEAKQDNPKRSVALEVIRTRQEFHTLFDRGFVRITPEHRVRVSPKIRERWTNGRRFYEFDDQPLRSVPKAVHEQPSADALRWHNLRRFAS